MSERISFFVSSTFKDMQGERDILHTDVMPRLTEYAASKGRTIEFLDLRWGISTDHLETDQGASKILCTCLDEIRYCSPYMIIILGDRYGWIPPANIIRDAAKNSHFDPGSDRISVTELEIRYGMWLNNNCLDRCIFCFRENVNPDLLSDYEKSVFLTGSSEDQQHMNALKEKILSNTSAGIIRYSLDNTPGTKDRYHSFSEKLYDRLKAILDQEWKDTPPTGWIKKQAQADMLTGNRLLESFYGRRSLLETLKEHTHTGFLCLIGDDGCGMSSLMAKLGETLAADGKHVRNIFCGNGFCADTEQLLKIMCAELTASTPEDAFETEWKLPEPSQGKLLQWKECWDSLSASYQGEPIYFLIDGIQHLLPDTGLTESIFLPGHDYSEKIFLVISKNRKTSLSPMATQQTKRWCDFFEIPNCDKEELKGIVTSMLQTQHKQIGDSVMDALLEHPLCSNMVCLDLLLMDLLHLNSSDFEQISQLEKTMSGNDAISFYLEEKIRKNPATPSELFLYWLRNTCSYLAKQDSEELHYLFYLFFMLGLPVNGISQNELSDMAELIRKCPSDVLSSYWLGWWEEARFSLLRRYLGPLLQKSPSGRYRFAHEQFYPAMLALQGASAASTAFLICFDSCEEPTQLKAENLIAVFLIYASTHKNVSQKLKEQYFYLPIQQAYHSKKQDPATIRSLYHSMSILILTTRNADYVTALCQLLFEKASAGISPDSDFIRFFTNYAAGLLSSSGTLAESLLLNCQIAILRGYLQWEENDMSHDKIDFSKRFPARGVYEEWTTAEHLTFADLWADTCLHHWNLDASLQDSVFVPEWDWTTLRDLAGKHINLFLTSQPYAEYLCARVCIMDASHNLSDASHISYMHLAETFNRRVLISLTKENRMHAPRIMKWYLANITDIARNYLFISDIHKQKGNVKHEKIVLSDVYALTRKVLKRLTHKKYISTTEDIPAASRLAFLSVLYIAELRFTTYEFTRQRDIRLLLELYSAARENQDIMRHPSSRRDVMWLATQFMEYLLDRYPDPLAPYIDASYQTCANRLLLNEGTYILALQQENISPETMYRLYLLRSLYFLLEKDTQEEYVFELKENIQSLTEHISHWETSNDLYLHKMKWLLEKNQEFLDTCK